MAGKQSRGSDEIFNINVGGKKFTVRKSVLTAYPDSKLCDWFKYATSAGGTTNAAKSAAVAQDKAGNMFIDRDGRTFRHIVNYLRLKRDKHLAYLALPAKPDALAHLLAEADSLRLYELRDMCLEMLQRYPHEEMGYATAYANITLKRVEDWVESGAAVSASSGRKGPSKSESVEDGGW